MYRLFAKFALLVTIWLGCFQSAYAQWTVGHTENFTITGDVKAEQAEAILQGLEAYRANMLRLLSTRNVAEKTPINIYVLESAREIKTVTGIPSFDALYELNVSGLHIALKAERRRGADEFLSLAQGAVANHLLRQASGDTLPRWYRQGYAHYLSSYSAKGDTVFIGKSANDMGLILDNLWVNMETVIDADKSYPERSITNRRRTEIYSMFSAQSWLLVHYIQSTPGMLDNFKNYTQRLREGEESQPAFEAAFGMNMDALKKTLQTYFKRNKFAVKSYTTPVKPEDFTVYLKPISDSQYKASLAIATSHLYRGDDYDKHVEALLREAREGAGFDPYVTMGMAYVSRSEERKRYLKNYLRRSLDNAPEDQLINRLVGGLLVDLNLKGMEIEFDTSLTKARGHLKKSMALAPSDPATHYYYALSYYKDANPPADAVKSAMLSMSYYDEDFMMNVNLQMAHVAARGGEFEQARSLTQYALSGRFDDKVEAFARKVKAVIDKG